MSFQMIGGDTNDPKQIVNAMNQNIAQLKVEENTKITKDSTGTRRVLLGSGLNDFNGLKVSQPGKDVYTATDDELVFNSDNNLFKIVDSATIEFDLNITIGGTNEVSIAHGLGYVPIVIAFQISSFDSYMLPFYAINGYGTADAGKVAYSITCYTDDENINFYYAGYTQGTGGPVTIRYYILQETAS